MNRTVKGDLLRIEGRNKSLEILTALQENTAVMKLTGSVSADLETDLMDEILAFVSVGRDVRLDFSGLEYICSTAQKRLVDIQCEYVDKLGTHLEICGVSAKIYALLRSGKMDTQIRIMRGE
ncbi:MAG: STAS domain-containing protein [Aristaeellaceae bacterium]